MSENHTEQPGQRVRELERSLLRWRLRCLGCVLLLSSVVLVILWREHAESQPEAAPVQVQDWEGGAYEHACLLAAQTRIAALERQVHEDDEWRLREDMIIDIKVELAQQLRREKEAADSLSKEQPILIRTRTDLPTWHPAGLGPDTW